MKRKGREKRTENQIKEENEWKKKEKLERIGKAKFWTT